MVTVDGCSNTSEIYVLEIYPQTVLIFTWQIIVSKITAWIISSMSGNI